MPRRKTKTTKPKKPAADKKQKPKPKPITRVLRNQNVRVNVVQTVTTGESTPGNQPEPLPFTRGWTMGNNTPAPTILQQPAASSIMRPHDHFKYAASPIAQSERQMPQAVHVPEKAIMEAANPRSFTPDSERSSTFGVKQLVRSFEDREQTGLDDSYIINNPHMFEPRVMDELAERLGIEFPVGKKRRGKEEKAAFIKRKLAERREKGKAPM